MPTLRTAADPMAREFLEHKRGDDGKLKPVRFERTGRVRLKKRNDEAGEGEADASDDRSFEIVLSAGADVVRYPWFGDPYIERLYVDGADLGRMRNGAPLLDGHFGRSVRSQLGVFEDAWMEDAEGTRVADGSDDAEIYVGSGRFSGRDDIAGVRQDYADGIIRNASVGYDPTHRVIEERDGELNIHHIRGHLVYEGSLVPMGADDAAGKRGIAIRDAHLALTDHPASQERGAATEPTMANEKTTEQLLEEARAAGRAEGKAEGKAEERKHSESRDAAIEQTLRATGLDRKDEKVSAIVGNRDLSADELRSKLIELRAAQSDDDAVANHHRGDGVSVGKEEIDKVASGIRNALGHRANPAAEELSEEGRYFRSLSLMEMGREWARRRGLDLDGDPLRDAGTILAFRSPMHSSSDFANLLADVTDKSLTRGYEAEPRTFLPFCRQYNPRDFKTVHDLFVSGGDALVKVTENGEYKRGTLKESKETWALSTYGKIIAITRKTLINDDLGAFSEVPEQLGSRVASLENDIMWALITDNANMSDGVALIHADHANLEATTTGAPAKGTVGATRLLFRKQTGMQSEKLRLDPSFILAPVAYETDLDSLFSNDIVANTVNDVVPSNMRSRLQYIVEPRLDDVSATRWYMAVAASSPWAPLVYGSLSGSPAPRTESRNGFDVDGVEVKISRDFGGGVRSWRGIARNGA